jgi:hypothetical protein
MGRGQKSKSFYQHLLIEDYVMLVAYKLAGSVLSNENTSVVLCGMNDSCEVLDAP